MNTEGEPMVHPHFYHDQMIGKLALAYRLISSEQYMSAISARKRAADQDSRFGDILVSKGFIEPDQLDFLERAIDVIMQKRKEKRFGNLAVSQGLISQEDLNRALARQKKEKKEIGQILLDQGLVTEEERAAILTAQSATPVLIPSLEDMRQLIEQKSIDISQDARHPVVNVSRDGLIAVIVLPEQLRAYTVKEIRSFIAEKGICFGITDDQEIKTFLVCRELGLHAFIAARGQKSVSPKTGPVALNFQGPSLNLDQDTGTRPQVSEGDIVAEREILKEGKPRITVYGVSLEPEEEGGDKVFLHGNGTRMDEQKSRIIAQHDGEPFLHPDGAVCVLTEKVHTDIVHDTGLVHHEGTLRITGKIDRDTMVHAAHIIVDRVDGGYIRVDGNLWVEGSLQGATVVSAGSVRAWSITDCTLSCVGDVLAETDVIGSTIDTQARCLVRKTVSHSTIKATRGIEVLSVLNKQKQTSMLEFGTSFLPRYLEENQASAESLEKSVADLIAKIQTQDDMVRITHQVMKDIQRDKARIERERAMLEASVIRMEEKNGRTVVTGRNRMISMGLEIQAAEETLKVLSQDIHKGMDTIGTLKKNLALKMKAYKEMKRKMDRKKTIMKARLKGHPSVAGLLVSGSIPAGTVIHGPHTVLTLEDKHQKVLVRERVLENQDGYTLEIGPVEPKQQ